MIKRKTILLIANALLSLGLAILSTIAMAYFSNMSSLLICIIIVYIIMVTGTLLYLDLHTDIMEFDSIPEAEEWCKKYMNDIPHSIKIKGINKIYSVNITDGEIEFEQVGIYD